ncbi:MAG: hypothetical protein MJ211_08415 [Bacteroidales bacterium]|nr:hypothetical protein [Bacteroidales bacterium]
MKTICLNINIHKPYLLKRYRFFDIGTDNFYFDEYSSRAEMEKSEKTCLKPALEMLTALTQRYNDEFKFSLTISGTALQMIEQCCSNSLTLIQNLVNSGNVECVGMPYNHSLAAVTDIDEFKRQVLIHSQEIERLFDVKPTTLRNTELIYTDAIGEAAKEIGFKTALVEGAGRSLDLKGPNFIYYNPSVPNFKVIPRNEDISRLLETALKDNKLFTPVYFAERLCENDENDDVIFIGINYEYLDNTKFNNRDVLHFITNLVDKIINSKLYKFDIPSNAIEEYKAVAPFHATMPVSGIGFGKNLRPWLGNELQQEAFSKVYALKDKMKIVHNEVLQSIWLRLQCSDYLYFMSEEYFDNEKYGYKNNPFKSPYDAFIDYMNILGDFERRVNESIENNETDTLTDNQIQNIISFYQNEIKNLKQILKNREKSK